MPRPCGQMRGGAYPLVRRNIGLSLLNSVGITALNHMTVLQFVFLESILQLPCQVAPMQAYSYRLNLSYAPQTDCFSDIAALPRFNLIVAKYDSFFLC